MKTKILSLFLIASCVFIMASSCEVSTANLTDVKMCEIPEGDLCAEDQAEFATDLEEIYVTAVLNNAPEGTQVTFYWRYLDEDPVVEIDSVTVDIEEVTSSIYSALTAPPAGWPTGRYEVELKIHTDNAEPVKKQFEIK